MSRGARMFAGVTIGRAVATQSRAALLTGAEMQPLSSNLHALGAFWNFRLFD